MNIIHITNNYNYEIMNKNKFIVLLNNILLVLKYKIFVELNIIIVNSNDIKMLNNKYRLINKETDILSFPIDMNENIIKKCGFNLLGDIYICDSKIKENAKKYNVNVDREYSYMFLHSVLHLMGYDHITTYEEKRMHEYILLAL